MHIFRYTLVLLLLSTVSSLAQDELARVNLSAISMDGHLIDLKYRSSVDVHSVNIFKGRRSRTFKYVGPQTIQFFRQSEVLDAEGLPVVVPVAVCDLPSKSGDYLLIMSKIPGEEERYRVTPISDNWDDFSLGSYRFLNLAPFDIALKIEEKTFRIKARNFTDVKSQISGNGNQQAIMVSLPEGQEPVRFFEGQMYRSEHIRMLYLIAPKPEGRPGTVTILEVPQGAPKRPEPPAESAI
jgi:hypothetical protein